MAKRQINFAGVDEEIRRGGGGGKRIPEGDYLLKIVKGTWEEGPKADYIRWTFQVAKGEHKGVQLRANTSLSPDALWNLRNLIFAAKGKNVAGKAMNFDPDSLTGVVVGSSVADDEYRDKIRSVPVDFFPKADYKEPDEEEDEGEEEEETEEEEDDEELEDVDLEDI